VSVTLRTLWVLYPCRDGSDQGGLPSQSQGCRQAGARQQRITGKVLEVGASFYILEQDGMPLALDPFYTNDQRDRFGALRCLQVMGCKLWIMEIERGLAKLSQFECEASRWAPSPSAGCAAGQKPSLSLDLLTPHCSTFTTDGQGSLPSSSTCLSCCAQVLPRAPFSGDELATQEGRPSGSSGRILTV